MLKNSWYSIELSAAVYVPEWRRTQHVRTHLPNASNPTYISGRHDISNFFVCVLIFSLIPLLFGMDGDG